MWASLSGDIVCGFPHDIPAAFFVIAIYFPVISRTWALLLGLLRNMISRFVRLVTHFFSKLA